MYLKLVADESVDFRIIEYLRTNNFEIYSIAEDSTSISDVEVLKISIELNSLIITEDKDFGEWVFAHKHETAGVILLRYHHSAVNRPPKAGKMFDGRCLPAELFNLHSGRRGKCGKSFYHKVVASPNILT